MSLTRKQLKELQLDDAVIEEIIAAHAATVEALKAERDAALSAASAAEEAAAQRDALAAQVAEMQAAQQSAAEVQAAFDAYRAQQDKARRDALVQEELREALRSAGCNPQAVELLLGCISPDDAVVEDGRVTNAQSLIAPVAEAYAAFFAQPTCVPAPLIRPPVTHAGPLTREELSRMSADEINRNWSAVKGVLSKGAI